MKIGHLDTPASAGTGAVERKHERRGGVDGAAKGGSEPSAKVDLSSTAAALSDSGAVEGSFDQAKVDRIAQAIRDGKFEINAEAVADKLIANAQELLGKAGN